MRLMTWNIQWGRGVASNGPAPVRLEATIDRIRNWAPDVVCLQEVCVNFPANTDGRADDQVEQLALAFPDYKMVFAPTTDWGATNGIRRFGNAILTKLPLICARSHVLPSPPDLNATHPTSTRSAVEVWLTTATDDVLHVVCTHLEYASTEQRQAQLAHVLALLAWRTSVGGIGMEPDGGHRNAASRLRTPLDAPPLACHTLVCGDFNCPQELNRFAEAGLVDLWRVAHPGLPHAATISVHQRARPEFRPTCFDYVFGDVDQHQVVSHQVDANVTASDHQPVLVELTI